MQQTFDYNQHKEQVESCFTRRKILTTVDLIILKLSYKYHRFRTKKKIASAYRYLKMFHPDVVAAQNRAREDGGLEDDAQWLRLAEMVRLIKKFKPSSVLECGSGGSTALLAKLCPGKVTTVEEDEHWKNRLLDTMGNLIDKINLIRADRVVKVKDGELVDHYDIDHNKYYDFVYVDGPIGQVPEDMKEQEIHVRDPLGFIPNVDVEMLWENNIFPRVVVVDCRRSAVRRFIEKSQGKYNVYLKSDFFMNTNISYFSKYRYHTILVRKEKPMEKANV